MSRLSILACMAFVLACGEVTAAPIAPAAASSPLQKLTHDVAVGLADPAARRSVLADLHDATVNKHAVELQSYLASPRGRDLLAAMSTATGQPTTQILALVRSIQPLKLYMPVTSHRAAWKGGANLYVASAIGRKDTPVAFALTGEPVSLSARTPPEIPTLGLVPVGHLRPDPRLLDLRSLSSLRAERIDAPPLGGDMREVPCTNYDTCDCDERAIYCDDPCANGCYPAPSPLPEKPAGIYMDQMIIRDAHEFWLRQSPEVDLVLWAYVMGDYVFNGYLPQATYVPPQGMPPGCVSLPWRPCVPSYPLPPSGNWPGGFQVNYKPSFVWDPNAVKRVYVGCAGEAASGWRRFDFNDDGGNTPPWGQALLAETEEFALVETIKDPGYAYAAVHQRRVALQGPFEIEILERDDGTECPEPPHYLEFAGSAGYTFAYYRHTAKFNNAGWSWTDLASLFGNNNDRIAIFSFANAAQLESLNHTFLSGWDADIVLSSVNFHVANIPPSADPFPSGDPVPSPLPTGCGETTCVPSQGMWISHFSAPGCGGSESYYLPYDGYAYSCRPWNGTGQCGTTRKTITNYSARSFGGACQDLWPAGNTLSDFVSVYR